MVRKVLDLASPPQVLELEHGNTCRILVYFDYVGDKYSGARLYAAIGLHGATFAQKVDNQVWLSEIPDTPVKTTYQVSIDIAITTDIALGTGYDMYAKLTNLPGADFYNYVDDVISIVEGAVPQYTLTTSVSPSNAAAAVIRQPDKTLYSQDESVIIAADSYGSWVFDHWIIDGVTQTANPIQLTMDGNRSATAYFSIPGTLTLNVSIQPDSTWGLVEKDPNKPLYDYNELVQLFAKSEQRHITNWKVNGVWQGASNPLNLTMNENKVVEAWFL